MSLPRHSVFLAILATLAGAIAGVFSWQPGIASLYDDSVSYLIMARAFSPSQAYGAEISAAFPNEKYPPLFPLLLALTGGASDVRLAHAFVAASFGASVFVLGLHARQITGSGAVGFVAAFTYAVMPGEWLNLKGILSEFPYIALSFAALACHERLRTRSPTRGEAVALGVLLAAVVLTRTIGAVLLAALVLVEGARYLRAREKERVLALRWTFSIPLIAGVLWYALRPAGGEDAYLASGAGVIRDTVEQGPGWLASMLAANASSLADAWLTACVIFWAEPWQPRFLLAAGLGLASLTAMLYRAIRLELDGLYGALFLLVLLLWPYPGQMFRLALPVFPVLVVCACWGAATVLRRRWEEPKAVRWACTGVLLPLALCVPALIYIAARAGLEEDPQARYRKSDIAEFYRIPFRPAAESNAARQIGVLLDMERIRQTTPDGARIMWYSPNYVALLAGRHGVPLAYPASREDLAAQVRRTGSDYLYFADVHPRDSAHRLGDPLAPAAYARDFSSVVWSRGGGEPPKSRALLLKIDRVKIETRNPARIGQ